jgi:hypothetical protein
VILYWDSCYVGRNKREGNLEVKRWEAEMTFCLLYTGGSEALWSEPVGRDTGILKEKNRNKPWLT